MDSPPQKNACRNWMSWVLDLTKLYNITHFMMSQKLYRDGNNFRLNTSFFTILQLMSECMWRRRNACDICMAKSFLVVAKLKTPGLANPLGGKSNPITLVILVGVCPKLGHLPWKRGKYCPAFFTGLMQRPEHGSLCENPCRSHGRDPGLGRSTLTVWRIYADLSSH